MERKNCEGCKLLGAMNTRSGPKDCCRYFYPPRALDEIDCKQSQYGFGIVVEPSIKKADKRK